MLFMSDASSKCKVTVTDSVTYFVPEFLLVLKSMFLPQTYDHQPMTHEQSGFGPVQTVLLTSVLSADFFFFFLMASSSTGRVQRF